MARVKGTNDIIGTIGDINYYLRNGKRIARKAGGGFTAEAIKNNPNMLKVRKNNSEFGRCSTVKKEFALALKPFLKDLNDGTLHGRLMREFVEIKNLDTVNDRGQRTVAQGMQTQRGRYLLTEFVFTPKCKSKHQLGGSWGYDTDIDAMILEGYDLVEKQFPKGATHLCLQVGRLHFDFDTLAHGFALSEPQFISPEEPNEPLVFPLDIPRADGMVLFVLRLRFYQCFPDERYPLNGVKSKGVELLGVL